ncbi:hypothetical protein ACFPFP_03385 [Bradyrhizobium sp. GCM10023182]|uniref:Uncharacterized protein n=1 Tax=Bradyrhizobium zhengyangense TaxID=2911009 RepID=A0ABS9LG27_9BRAD|nr:hypothetical protein [Bradyrhizobium zhengyangense]MCG2665969.1 hypothetical protein [Bradyrhizobium zhengyangense]
MKIHAHAESHVVELDDGSCWQIFPGDLAATLSWKPETELHLAPSGDRIDLQGDGAAGGDFGGCDGGGDGGGGD